jgi:hypothetical protein
MQFVTAAVCAACIVQETVTSQCGTAGKRHVEERRSCASDTKCTAHTHTLYMICV